MKKIKLNAASMEATEILSRDKLKTIFGGSQGGYSVPSVCYAETIMGLIGKVYSCYNNADSAESFAGNDGWWCCNCQTAYNICPN